MKARKNTQKAAPAQLPNTLPKLAAYLREHEYERTSREENGQRVFFYRRVLGEHYLPLDWIDEMNRAAHGEEAPNDDAYEQIVSALDLFAGEAADADFEALIDQIEADPYYGQLVQWFAGSMARLDYVDEALGDYEAKGIREALYVAQANWKQNIARTVFEHLSKKIAEINGKAAPTSEQED